MARGRRLRSVPVTDFEVALARARDDDPAGYRWLFEAFNRQLAGFVRSRGAADVDAVVSETLVRAFNRVDRFAGDESGFRAWLFAICRNILIDEARARERRPPTTDADDAVDAVAVGGVEDEVVERVDDLASELLAVLTDEQREVVTLRVIGGLTISDVARIVGKPESAVKSLQHRALRTLQKKTPSVPVSPDEFLSLS